MFRFRSSVAAAFALCFLFAAHSIAEVFGPIRSREQLLQILPKVHGNDTLSFIGDLDADGIVFPGVHLTLTSSGARPASLHNLVLHDASTVLQRINVKDSFRVSGNSSLVLKTGARVLGGDSKAGLVFDGCGVLITENGSSITGGNEADGLCILHKGGAFYAGLEGTVCGGTSGGTGVSILSLTEQSSVLIAGQVLGGDGSFSGGDALHLYGLQEQAFVSVVGSIKGGAGSHSGDGIRIVSCSDNAFIGINASVSAGVGGEYGGNAILVMDARGSSLVSITGALSGGNIRDHNGVPGQSILIADNASIGHVVVHDCLLEDGSFRIWEEKPVLPSITSSISRPSAMTTPTPFPDISQ